MALRVTTGAPIVSILMPVHNGERFLCEAIESILNQSLTDFEFIVINDASTDSTAEVLAGYASRDPRIRVAHNSRKSGVAYSLNYGLTLARANYIARQDADDISEPDRLQLQVKFLGSAPQVGLVSSLVQTIDEAGSVIGSDPYASGLENEAIQALLLKHNCICHGSVMFRKDCLKTQALYDEQSEPTEDYDLWLRMAEVTQMAKLPATLYKYRLHTASVNSRQRGVQMVKQAQSLEKAIRRRYEPVPPITSLEQVARTYLMAADYQGQRGETERAEEMFGLALAVCPPLFARNDIYVPVASTEAGIAVVESQLMRLPQTADNKRLKAKLLARLHMRLVFAAGQVAGASVERHLYRALRYDPAWLFNWGVLARIARFAGRRMLGLLPGRSFAKSITRPKDKLS